MQLLDCTLRDGGYINDWNFGEIAIKDIIRKLVESQVDYIEIGFLRDCEYDVNRTLFNNISEAKRILPETKKNSKFSLMALHDKYDINKLENNDGTIDLIRVTFHDYDIDEGLNFICEAQKKGYKCSCNPINIMGYSDIEILKIIDKVNKIKPFAFSIVDTFGAMMKEDLVRIYSLVEHNLDKNITIGLHLHENLSLSYSLAQEFVAMHAESRKCIIDGSLLGMGRTPGNLGIELIMDYMNLHFTSPKYDVGCARDAIDDYISKIKQKSPWGYSSAYAISAKYNLHRNYAENLVSRGMLNTREIEEIISRIEKRKKTVYDKEYIDNLFYNFQNYVIDDSEDLKVLRECVTDKRVLLIAPGHSIITYKKDIEEYIQKEKPIVISANFSTDYPHEFEFFTNSKRYENVKKNSANIIITSNLVRANKPYDYAVNYGRIATNSELGDNNMVMLLKLLLFLGVKNIAMAGFDGYSDNSTNYFDNMFDNAHKDVVKRHTDIIAEYLNSIDQKCQMHFITPSLYERQMKRLDYKVVIFDLDGTLLNTTEGVEESVRHTIDMMGLPMPNDEVINTFVGPPMTDSFKRVFHVSNDVAQEASTLFRSHYKANGLYKAELYDGIKDLLNILKNKGMRIAVATYKKEDAALLILHHFGLIDFFDSIHGADAENKLTKADIINMCIKETGNEELQKVVLIGDSEYDAIGAHDVGIQFLGVTYGFGFRNENEVNKYSNIGVAESAKMIGTILTQEYV